MKRAPSLAESEEGVQPLVDLEHLLDDERAKHDAICAELKSSRPAPDPATVRDSAHSCSIGGELSLHYKHTAPAEEGHRPPEGGRGHASQSYFLPIGLSDKLSEFDRLRVPKPPATPPPARRHRPKSKQRRRPVPPVSSLEQRERAHHKRELRREFIAAIDESNGSTRVCEMGCVTARDMEESHIPLSWLPPTEYTCDLPVGEEPILLLPESLRPAAANLLETRRSTTIIRAKGPRRERSTAKSVRLSGQQLSKLISQIDAELSAPHTAREHGNAVVPQYRAPLTERNSVRTRAKLVSKKAAQASLTGEWLTEGDCEVVLRHCHGQQRRMNKAIRGCDKQVLAAEERAARGVNDVLHLKSHRQQVMRSCVLGKKHGDADFSIGAATEAHRQFRKQFLKADAKIQRQRQEASAAYTWIHRIFKSLLPSKRRQAELKRVGPTMDANVPAKLDAPSEHFFQAYHTAVCSEEPRTSAQEVLALRAACCMRCAAARCCAAVCCSLLCVPQCSVLCCCAAVCHVPCCCALLLSSPSV
eukprot:TRINITY_DN8999_c0_g1_i3.p1 TRINITY_DN8999_c0_g1~~TRINITY_DN8999_c0_g1_i3.p1  ORF type:complete len:531 (-),score=116.09 TRINITY_DN8999_c0_g1_i3:430-2022(-)